MSGDDSTEVVTDPRTGHQISVVVEGVTITLPSSHHHIQDDETTTVIVDSGIVGDGFEVEEEIIEEEEIEIGVIDGDKLVLSAAAEEMINGTGSSNAAADSDDNTAALVSIEAAPTIHHSGDEDVVVTSLVEHGDDDVVVTSLVDHDVEVPVVIDGDDTRIIYMNPEDLSTHTTSPSPTPPPAPSQPTGVTSGRGMGGGGASFVIKRPNRVSVTNVGASDGKARPYKCDLCGKVFTKPEVLKRHKRSHNSHKDFSCTFCGMTFHRRDCLTDHMRNHTGERPFECTICNKKFTRGFVLLRHMRIHADGEFKCNVCHKSFDRKDTFNDHLRNHTGEKPYKCRYCPKSFSRSFVLTKHEKNHVKKSKYEEFEKFENSNRHTAEPDNILEYEEACDTSTEILIHNDFDVVIEEPNIEMVEEELEIDEARSHSSEDPAHHDSVLDTVYSILPEEVDDDQTTLQSDVLVAEPVTEEEVVTHDASETITLTSADGQIIRVITREQYDKLLQVARKNNKIFKCDACRKTFTSESTYDTHFEMPWDRGGCIQVK